MRETKIRNNDTEFCMDEKTLLVHDLWLANKFIEDAQYRTPLVLKGENCEKVLKLLDEMWDELNDLRNIATEMK